MKNRGGRPTKYKPEYCDMLIEHMSQGLSYETFAAVLSVSLDSLYEWEHKHPLFSEAKKEGRQKQRMTFEKIGMNAALGKIKDFNATAYVWLSKNMLGWRDKQDIEISGKDGGPIQTHTTSQEAKHLTDAELKKRLRSILNDQ